jgi:hypothetical protein
LHPIFLLKIFSTFFTSVPFECLFHNIIIVGQKDLDNQKLLHVLELMAIQDVKRPNVHHCVKVHIRIKGQKTFKWTTLNKFVNKLSCSSTKLGLNLDGIFLCWLASLTTNSCGLTWFFYDVISMSKSFEPCVFFFPLDGVLIWKEWSLRSSRMHVK